MRSAKDNTIKFWDITSGLCVNTLQGHLGEVTSVAVSATGTMLVSCSKDNSNRLWDLRAVRQPRAVGVGRLEVLDEAHAAAWRPEAAGRAQLQTRQRLKGHQNTSKNFVRASFGHKSLVVSGSEVGGPSAAAAGAVV